MSGFLVHVEGVDFSGKTSLVAWLTSELAHKKINAISVREPGGTEAGEPLRSMIAVSKSTYARFFMFRAASAQLHSEVVLPHLEDGYTVVSDRGFLSGLAYNSWLGAGDIDPQVVAHTHLIAAQGRMPDLTVLLMAHPQDLRSRQHADEQGQDDLGYDHLVEKVHEGYRRIIMSDEYSADLAVIDAGATQDFVRVHALQIVLEKLREKGIYSG